VKIAEADFILRHCTAGTLDTKDKALLKIKGEITDEHTMIGGGRLEVIYHLVKDCRELDGDMAEVGVWRGGSGRMIARAASDPRRIVHLFDTFTGLPAADAELDPTLHEGQFGDTDYERVHEYLKDLSNVRIHEGVFPATAHALGDTKFSFVHVDCDLRQAILDCCEFFWPRMAHEGVMLFDDTTYYDGAVNAVNEFFDNLPVTPIKWRDGQVTVRADHSATMPARTRTTCPHCGEEMEIFTQAERRD